MTEEELKTISQRIFAEVIESIEFPSNITFAKDESGEYAFTQFLSNNLGIAMFVFKPNVMMLSGLLKNPQRLSPAVGEMLSEEVSTLIAQTFLYCLLTNFHLEIQESFDNFIEIPRILMKQLPGNIEEMDSKFGSGEVTQIIEKQNSNFDDFIKKRGKTLRNRLNSQIRTSTQFLAPNKNLLFIFYSDYLESWQAAKKCYKVNKIYKNWEKMISTAFPDLPSDLIFRLGNEDPYLSMPSAIALEHSARMCGYMDDAIEPRSLQNYLKSSKIWTTNKTEDEVIKEVDNFFSNITSFVITFVKIALSTGKKVDLSHLPYVYRLIYKGSLKDESTE